MNIYVHRIFLTEIYFTVPKYPYEANKFKNLALIAGGTGITPMVRNKNRSLFLFFFIKINVLILFRFK